MSVFWTNERLKFAWERHFWHPTLGEVAAELRTEWNYPVTGAGLAQALRQAFPGHNFRSTVGTKKRMQEIEEREAMLSSCNVGRAAEGDNEAPKVAPSESVPGRHGQRIIVIPDTQVRAGVPLEHLDWAAQYIADQKPDGVLHLGDHWDNHALSSYDSPGKKAHEQRRYRADTDHANEGMQRLSAYRSTWRPSWEWYLDGNHDHRVTRALEADHTLIGTIGLEDRWLEGWTVHPFLEVVTLPDTDILACHYFTGPTSPRPVGGTAHNLLRKVGKSCIMGHRQILDSACAYLPDGTQRRSLIAGAFYLHDEDYRQSNGEWRGILMLNEVDGGTWDQCEVSLGYLRRKYG